MTKTPSATDFDVEKFAKPVTRAELWSLLLQIDLLAHTARTMAIAAVNQDIEGVEKLRAKYQKLDDEFTESRDKLIKSDKVSEA